MGRKQDRYEDSQLQETLLSTSDDSSLWKTRFLFIRSLNRDSLSTYCAPSSVLSSGDKAENKTDQLSVSLVLTLWYGR